MEKLKTAWLAPSDQKFSVAGNAEGIYIALSKVVEKPFLDTNSKILLEGNTGLAWAYVKKVEERADLLKGALDHEYDFCFLRAVVTQNRTLSEVDGFPTTFDFSGLTIDASSSMTNYSNRGNYKNHWDDFLLLLTDESSYYEGQLFDDVAGLTGISTVKGLQYAYNNPQTYTVHTINSVNESVIDTLSLSANTKANMHFEIQTGGTVITPNKAVTDGAFSGVLYVVSHLESDGDSRVSYYIGEQVANGGWSIDGIENEEYCYEENGQYYCYLVYEVVKGTSIYLIEDKEKNMIQCNISQDDFNQVLSDPEYETKYGLPCYKPEQSLLFGDIEHTYRIATNGTRFFSPGQYEYWLTVDEIGSKIDNYIEQNSISGTQSFEFSTIMGTYLIEIGDDKAVYYSPNGNNGDAYLVDEDIFEKLESDDKKAEKELGYPTGDVTIAEESIAGTNGECQNFIGGQIYWIDNTWPFSNETYYVPGQIDTFYNSSENCKNLTCGSGGIIGFPTSDPFIVVNGIKQTFEEGDIFVNLNGIVNLEEQSMESNKYQIQNFVRNLFWGKVDTGAITDVEAFSKIAEYISGKNGVSDEDFVRLLTTVLLGYETIGAYGFYDSFLGSDNSYRILGFSDTGFKFEYNDSHYCMDPFYRCISNQLFHAMLGFNTAYFYDEQKGRERSLKHDKNANPLSFGGDNYEDISLGFKMSRLGQMLQDGDISKEEVKGWIMDNLAALNYEDLRMEQGDFVNPSDIPNSQVFMGIYKKKFRTFEYMSNGNEENKWNYSEDMEVKECQNGKVLYYQDYNYFHIGGADLYNLKLIWNKYDDKMIVVYDSSSVLDGVCDDLDEYTNNFGYSLTMDFNDMLYELASEIIPD